MACSKCFYRRLKPFCSLKPCHCLLSIAGIIKKILSKIRLTRVSSDTLPSLHCWKRMKLRPDSKKNKTDTWQSLAALWMLHRLSEGSACAVWITGCVTWKVASVLAGFVLSSQPTDCGCQSHSPPVLWFLWCQFGLFIIFIFSCLPFSHFWPLISSVVTQKG